MVVSSIVYQIVILSSSNHQVRNSSRKSFPIPTSMPNSTLKNGYEIYPSPIMS